MKHFAFFLMAMLLLTNQSFAEDCAVEEKDVHKLFFNTMNLWNPSAFSQAEFRDHCNHTVVKKQGINVKGITSTLGAFGMGLFIIMFLLEATRRMLTSGGLHFTASIRLYATSAVVGVLIVTTFVGPSGSALYEDLIRTVIFDPIAAISNMMAPNSTAGVKEKFVEAFAAYSKANQDSESFWSFIPFIDLNVGALFANVAVLLALLIVWVVSIYVSVMCTLVLCLGPIFLPFLIFRPLSQIGWNWIRAIIAYPMMCLVGSAVTAMVMRTDLLRFSITTGEGANYTSAIAASIVLVMLSTMVPSLTNSIVGGISGSPSSASGILAGAAAAGMNMGGSARNLAIGGAAAIGGTAAMGLGSLASKATGGRVGGGLARTGRGMVEGGFHGAVGQVKNDLKDSFSKMTSLGRSISNSFEKKAKK